MYVANPIETLRNLVVTEYDQELLKIWFDQHDIIKKLPETALLMLLGFVSSNIANPEAFSMDSQVECIFFSPCPESTRCITGSIIALSQTSIFVTLESGAVLEEFHLPSGLALQGFEHGVITKNPMQI